MKREVLILGGGISGMAAGMSSSFPVFEAKNVPGGICASYYLKLGSDERLEQPPRDEEAFRFEVGGGHWIWGADASVRKFFERFSPMQSYQRRAAVFLPSQDVLVPYPLQHNLRYLGKRLAAQCLSEIVETSRNSIPASTMAEWLLKHFGKTLCEMFFHPFHELYTSGLSTTIAPQDPSKSPIDLALVAKGTLEDVPPVGYNDMFFYPLNGLDGLVRGMANRCKISYNKKAIAVDTHERVVIFADGEKRPYQYLLSSAPLKTMLELCHLSVEEPPDPYTSVLVLNLAAIQGPNAPSAHWVYVPHSSSGFHRVGFYSNVDEHFLPSSLRKKGTYISLYVEKAVRGGQGFESTEQECYRQQAVSELQSWRWIGEVLASDLTFVDVAYTWPVPGSSWRMKAIEQLRKYNIIPLGRYGTWAVDLKEQGIVHSLTSGLLTGALFRQIDHGTSL